MTRLIPVGSLAALLMVVGLGAQTPLGPRGRGGSTMPMDAVERQDMRVNMMASNLGLTEDQKRPFRAIFAEGQRAAEPFQEQISTGRRELIQAVRERRPQADIERLTENQGSLLARITALEAGVIAKRIAWSSSSYTFAKRIPPTVGGTR